MRESSPTPLISDFVPAHPGRFREWAASIADVSPNTPIEELAQRLIDGKHTVTDDEAMEESRRTNHRYFYFKENVEGGVSVGSIGRAGRWRLCEDSFDCDEVWGTDYHLLIRNAGTLKL